MLVGLIVYVVTRKKYLGLAGTVVPNPLKKEEKGRLLSIILTVLVILGIVALVRYKRWLANCRSCYFLY